MLVVAAGCATSNKSSTSKDKPAKSPAPSTPKGGTTTQRAPLASPKADTTSRTNKPSDDFFFPKVSSTHDIEIKEILKLAAANHWEEAEVKAEELDKKDPTDASVIRVVEWVKKQRQSRRDEALEHSIRAIDSENPVFNPTLPDLLKDKDRGLPPRHDVRKAVEQIQATPYIPETFNKTRHEKSRLFDLEAPEGSMTKLLAKPISVHLDNVTLESIIFSIGQAEGINFIADKSIPAFKQTLSVNMDKVKLSEFLRYVSRNLDVQFQVGDDLVWIVDAKDPKRMLEETRIYHLKNGFLIPAQFGPTEVARVTTTAGAVVTTSESFQTKKFVNDGASATPAIEVAIKQFFAGSKYQIDYERNLVVARGTADQLETMDKLVAAYDKPMQQVLIEARFITISEAAFLQLGVNWDAGGTKKRRDTVDFTGLGNFGGNEIGIGAGIQQTTTNSLFRWPNSISQSELTATLNALQQSGESQTLSAPRLTLVNNLPAMINDGQVQYYYEEYQVKQTVSQYLTQSDLVPSGKPTKITAGVSLYVLASIGGDGKTILLALNPQVNEGIVMQSLGTIGAGTNANGSANSFTLKLPSYRTQELATRVMVKSGETVAMGGVLQREQTTLVESVPVLSRIPILGALFRKHTSVDKPRYLLIFVTATLLSDTGEFMAYDKEEPKK
ncbi:MAG: type secretory pathway protein [Verrucomicrobiales bacterium]|nr:type secretory pathway protein [Verrucomicrobiales bacterium]